MYSVILVDDERLIKLSLQKLINESPHYKVIGTANDGAEALELQNSLHADLIITDIRMPVMDGLELIKALNEAGHDAEIILLTGYAEFDYAKQALQLGAVDYLLKPVETESLFEALDRTYALLQTKKNTFPDASRKEWIWECKELSNLLTEIIWDIDVIKLEDCLKYIHNQLSSEEKQWGNLVSLYTDLLTVVEKDVMERSRGTLPLTARDHHHAQHTLESNKDISTWFEESIHAMMELIRTSRSWSTYQVMEKAIQYIETHYHDESLSLSATAKELGISTSYLSRIFSEEKGISFIQYLKQYRMNKSVDFLQAVHLKTYEVAQKVGYSDYPHFARTFKKHFGISASSFRKKNNLS